MNYINDAIKENDLNTALRIVQDAIGQTAGDVAGQFFAQWDDAEDKWTAAAQDERKDILEEYIRFEESDKLRTAKS